jgi:hypothetical protein
MTNAVKQKGSARPGGLGSEAPAPWGAGRALPVPQAAQAETEENAQ